MKKAILCVMKLEDKYWHTDGIIEGNIKQIVIRLRGNIGDSESDKNSACDSDWWFGRKWIAVKKHTWSILYFLDPTTPIIYVDTQKIT